MTVSHANDKRKNPAKRDKKRLLKKTDGAPPRTIQPVNIDRASAAAAAVLARRILRRTNGAERNGAPTPETAPKPTLAEKVAAIYSLHRGCTPIHLVETSAADLREVCLSLDLDPNTNVSEATIRQMLEIIEVLEAVAAELSERADGKAVA
jgi:hypothetical protein